MFTLVPKDGIEHWSDHYEVLCGGSIKWIPSTEKQENLITGGQAGNGIAFYVCRGVFKEKLIPGKYYEPTGCCYIPCFGKEECVTDYSLLSEKPEKFL